MVKLAIFDLDGTVLFTLGDLLGAMNYAMRSVGAKEITIEQASAYIGNGIRKFTSRALGTTDDDERVDCCVAAFKEYYGAHLADRTVPYDGIVEMLQKLREAGIKTAVLSNKYNEATVFLIKRFFPGLIDAAYGECEKAPRKPSPTGVMLICSELGVSAEETVFIGDSPVDFKTAQNAKTSHIGVSWGYRSVAQLTDAGVENIAYSADELYEKIIRC